MADIFIERCVSPLENGDRADLAGLVLFDEAVARKRDDRSTGRSGMPSDVLIAVDELKSGELSGCRVSWEGSANREAAIDVDMFIDRMENWSEAAVESGRYSRKSECADDDFDWSLTLDNEFPREPHLRLAMFHKKDIDFLMLVAAETPTRERGEGC